MTGFIAVVLLICPINLQRNVSGCRYKNDKNDYHFAYIRESSIIEYERLSFRECDDGEEHCKKRVWKGCEFTLDSGKTIYSALVCPSSY